MSQKEDARLGKFMFGSVYLGTESRLFLIWPHLGLPLFTGDGKDNIYSKLICKLHFRVKAWNLNSDFALKGSNPETQRISEGLNFLHFSLPWGLGLSAPVVPPFTPSAGSIFSLLWAVDYQFRKQIHKLNCFVGDKNWAVSKAVTYSFD